MTQTPEISVSPLALSAYAEGRAEGEIRVNSRIFAIVGAALARGADHPKAWAIASLNCDYFAKSDGRLAPGVSPRIRRVRDSKARASERTSEATDRHASQIDASRAKRVKLDALVREYRRATSRSAKRAYRAEINNFCKAWNLAKPKL